MNGIFSKYDPDSKFIFNDNKWITNELHAIRNKFADRVAEHEHLAEFIHAYQLNNVSILDLGGSFGFGYFAVKDLVKSYDIVEVPNLCDIARAELSNENSNLKFNTEIPNKNIELIYCRTSLQYANDWRNLLEKLFALGAKYILFCHLSAGNIPTFIASQNYCGDKIPYWFINIDDISCMFNEYGYEKLFIKKCQNVPDEWYDDTIDQKIPNTLDLAYKRSE